MSTYVKIKESYFKRDDNIAVDISVLFQYPFPFTRGDDQGEINGHTMY
jgi:hypothetical protein